MSQRGLSLAAGLTGSHVGTIVRRLRADPGASIEDATLRAIARGGGVDYGWLVTGRGLPEGAPPARAMPNFEAAAASLQASGAVRPATVAVVRAWASAAPADLSPDAWTLVLLGMSRAGA